MKPNLFFRILAIILLLIYLVLLGVFIFFLITGSEYLMAMLFVIIIYPVILYILVWLKKVFSSD
ncbi:hypothetical protein SAMN02910369_00904 [Lachnospiraceae bacterium NE2001]|nr:hypothetical protein SAMN02910369_00904 [Lachnospiraceae bacterium NE2001]